MACKDERIDTIIFEQIAAVEERCGGCREGEQLALAEIIQAERKHQFGRTKSVSKTGDLVGRVAAFALAGLHELLALLGDRERDTALHCLSESAEGMLRSGQHAA